MNCYNPQDVPSISELRGVFLMCGKCECAVLVDWTDDDTLAYECDECQEKTKN